MNTGENPMNTTNYAIIRGTKYRNVPAVLVTPEDVTLQIGPVMLNHSTTTPTEQFKTCVRCGETKPLSEYYAAPRNKARTRPHCKACHLADAAPESRWQVMTKGMRKRLGYAPSVPVLREALGEPCTCYLCGNRLTWDEAVVDHVLPISRGGDHGLDNLKWTHRQCNAAKGAMTLEEFVYLARQVVELHGEFSSLNFPELREVFS